MTHASHNPPPDIRLQQLARRVHELGPRPLYELFRELVAGADPTSRIEVYAGLNAEIIQAFGGDRLVGPRVVVAGGRQ